MGDWFKDMSKAVSNVGKAMGNEAKRAVDEAGRHVTESIDSVGKSISGDNGGIAGFVGGAMEAADKFSPGNMVAGAVDAIIPGEDLPKPVSELISSGVNLAVGTAVNSVVPGAGLPLQVMALVDAGQAVGALLEQHPQPKTPAPGTEGGQRMQTPESPSAARDRVTTTPRHRTEQLREAVVIEARGSVSSVGGGTVERMEDKTVITASNRNDNISVERQRDGSVKVSINGESMTLTKEEAENLIILAKAGKDTVNVKGVDGVQVFAGSGSDRVVVEGDNAKVVGGAGKDRIVVDGDNARVSGGKGNDRLNVNGNNATVGGGRGVDVMTVEGDNADIRGGRGMDIIKGGGRNASIDGGGGKTINRFEDRPPQLSTRDGLKYHQGITDFMKNHPGGGFGGQVVGRDDIGVGGGGGVDGGGFVSNDFMDIEVSQPGKPSRSGDAKLAKLQRDLDKATRDIERILNDPNLSFEDMIFLLMRAVIKQSEAEVKIELQSEKNSRDAASASRKDTQAGFNAETNALNKEQVKIAGMKDGPEKQTAQAELAEKKSKLDQKKEAFGADFSEKADARNEKFEEIKEALQKVSEMQQALSNIMNALHQTAMNAIGNIR